VDDLWLLVFGHGRDHGRVRGALNGEVEVASALVVWKIASNDGLNLHSFGNESKKLTELSHQVSFPTTAGEVLATIGRPLSAAIPAASTEEVPDAVVDVYVQAVVPGEDHEHSSLVLPNERNESDQKQDA
jgi:hypothetical protein